MNSPVELTSSAAPLFTVPGSPRPKISFVMVSYGTGRIIERSLEAIARSVGDVTAEFIVVDNLHPVHGHRTASRLALNTVGVRLVRASTNLGFGGGNELGALHARGELLCFINPDVLPTPGWVTPMLDSLHEHPDSIIAPRLRNLDGSIQEAGQTLSTAGDTAPRLDATPHCDAVTVDYASAACWLMTRSLHERCGGFDPRFHPAYYEDVDFALRVRLLGGSTIVADADVTHLRGSSTAGAEPSGTERQQATLCNLWKRELRRQPIFS